MKNLLLTIFCFGSYIVCNAQSAPMEIYLGATNEMNFNWASSEATVTEVSTNSPYEGTTHYKIDYNITNWYAGGAFNINDFGFGVKQDYTNYTHLVIAWKFVGSVANTIVVSLTDSTKPTNIIGADVVLSNSSSYQIDTIPLSSFKGATQLNLGNIHGFNWHIGSLQPASTGQVYIDNVRILDLSTSGKFENTTKSVFSVYPNPSSGMYTVQSSAKIDAFVVSNCYGKTVESGGALNAGDVIDLSNHPEGMYYVTVTSNGNQSSQKLIKGKL